MPGGAMVAVKPGISLLRHPMNISEMESVFALVIMEFLKPNISEMRSNSGMVIHFKESVYVVRYDGADCQLHLSKYDDENDPVRELDHGAMIVLESDIH